MHKERGPEAIEKVVMMFRGARPQSFSADRADPRIAREIGTAISAIRFSSARAAGAQLNVSGYAVYEGLRGFDLCLDVLCVDFPGFRVIPLAL
jgi:hypothetical protein